MPTTPYQEYVQFAQPHVPGCPEFVIEEHIAEAANKFCKKSYAWRQELAAQNTVVSVSDYVIPVPAGTTLEDVVHLEVDKAAQVRISDKDWQQVYGEVVTKPRWYALVQDTTLRMYPTPDAVYEYRGTLVLVPTLSATGAESFLFNNHARCIAYGAVATLKATPGKEWTDFEGAVFYKTKFQGGIDEARIRDNRGVRRQVRFQPFA